MKKENLSFDVDEPFFIICRVCCEVVEDTNYLIAFLNPATFFENFVDKIFMVLFLKKICKNRCN
jgi:hypothetical protein